MEQRLGRLTYEKWRISYLRSGASHQFRQSAENGSMTLLNGNRSSRHVSRGEAHRLLPMNEKQKQKRKRSTRRIPGESGMIVPESQEITQAAIEAVEAPITIPARPAIPASIPPRPARWKLPTCGKCGNEGHRANHCSSRCLF